MRCATVSAEAGCRHPKVRGDAARGEALRGWASGTCTLQATRSRHLPAARRQTRSRESEPGEPGGARRETSGGATACWPVGPRPRPRPGSPGLRGPDRSPVCSCIDAVPSGAGVPPGSHPQRPSPQHPSVPRSRCLANSQLFKLICTILNDSCSALTSSPLAPIRVVIDVSWKYICVGRGNTEVRFL